MRNLTNCLPCWISVLQSVGNMQHSHVAIYTLLVVCLFEMSLTVFLFFFVVFFFFFFVFFFFFFVFFFVFFFLFVFF